MQKLIFIGALITFIIRILPIFLTRIFQLGRYPSINKFFEYTICLITGEIIYSTGIGNLPILDIKYLLLNIATLIFTIFTMWKTNNLTFGMVLPLIFFILAWNLIER